MTVHEIWKPPKKPRMAADTARLPANRAHVSTKAPPVIKIQASM
jgi:hypothetical protein